MAKKYSGEERRRDRRRPILESFSMFVSFPERGFTKLPMHDISEVGIAFFAQEVLEFKSGEVVQGQVYLNQSLSIPCLGRVVRVLQSRRGDDMQEVALEFHDLKHPGVMVMTDFLKFLDRLSAIANLEK